ncbi:MAG: NlpC/P60 family protein [Caldicoprobacterales bacterium]|jgi:cell wall-associated NlpC family hydrolase|nr:peptidoglycan endopeptidase [Clostridiales bacterium]
MGHNIDERKIRELLEKYKNAKFLHNGRSLEEGIDCLGFVILFYRDLGIELPNDDGKPIEEDWYKKDPDRYIRAIKSLGFKEVKYRDLRPLDMVYFAISKNIITHTGIMINRKEFAHMSPNKGFLISRLERGWLSRARGAVRVIQ